jgi:peptide/nickel transport system ATP-binding protein/oligopeptide transport system ATP-binding protein
MYAGQVVESGPVEEIFERPRMPYTAGLIASIPRLGGSGRGQRLRTIPGNVPALLERPAGCRFVTRCTHATPECGTTLPALESVAEGHEVRCLRWRELDLAAEVAS